MIAALLSSSLPPEKIRREIADLKREISASCDKRDRLDASIKRRVEKLNRLQAQQLIASEPGNALSPALACG